MNKGTCGGQRNEFILGGVSTDDRESPDRVSPRSGMKPRGNEMRCITQGATVVSGVTARYMQGIRRLPSLLVLVAAMGGLGQTRTETDSTTLAQYCDPNSSLTAPMLPRSTFSMSTALHLKLNSYHRASLFFGSESCLFLRMGKLSLGRGRVGART
jgi:hypothetical protein